MAWLGPGGCSQGVGRALVSGKLNRDALSKPVSCWLLAQRGSPQFLPCGSPSVGRAYSMEALSQQGRERDSQALLHSHGRHRSHLLLRTFTFRVPGPPTLQGRSHARP